MEANHVEALFRNGGSVVHQDTIQVLVVSPRHENPVETTVLLVHSQLGAAIQYHYLLAYNTDLFDGHITAIWRIAMGLHR